MLGTPAGRNYQFIGHLLKLEQRRTQTSVPGWLQSVISPLVLGCKPVPVGIVCLVSTRLGCKPVLSCRECRSGTSLLSCRSSPGPHHRTHIFWHCTTKHTNKPFWGNSTTAPARKTKADSGSIEPRRKECQCWH